MEIRRSILRDNKDRGDSFKLRRIVSVMLTRRWRDVDFRGGIVIHGNKQEKKEGRRKELIRRKEGYEARKWETWRLCFAADSRSLGSLRELKSSSNKETVSTPVTIDETCTLGSPHRSLVRRDRYTRYTRGCRGIVGKVCRWKIYERVVR